MNNKFRLSMGNNFDVEISGKKAYLSSDFDTSNLKINTSQNVAEIDCSKFALEFHDVKSIDNMIESLAKARKVFDNEENDVHVFTVPIKNILIPRHFVNPNLDKVLESMKIYDETKKLNHKIIINENMVLLDGYVSYLVARYHNLKEVEVVAKNGVINVHYARNVIPMETDELRMNVKYNGNTFYVDVRCGKNSTFVLSSCSRDAISSLIINIENTFKAVFDLNVEDELCKKNLFTYEFMDNLTNAGLKTDIIFKKNK